MMPTNAMTMMIFIVSSIARARDGLCRMRVPEGMWNAAAAPRHAQRADPSRAKQLMPCRAQRAAS
jgi:hypothetical protein